ncbi:MULTISPECIES: hypothetical protein [unclassified Microbacterium]|uniref:hypothetical protein n=1 Tax=unclassified Microbacterium TaxID=2609290 RepID=UPI003444F6EE
MTRTWVRELTGWVLALAIALAAAGAVASSARAELLFRDGDSVIVALVARSLLAGDPIDWAMSSVLFLPETAQFTALDAVLPVGVDALLAVSAVLNVLALYGAVRTAGGRARDGRAPVAWSVVAVAVFGLLALTETSASRDALELASLQLTTTYYSSTVVAVVLSIGLVRRMRDGSVHRILLPVLLAGVAAVSTASNPLYAAWLAAPLLAMLLVDAARAVDRRRSLALVVTVIVGVAAGFALRIPLSAWIANTGAGYVQPGQWRESIEYYGRLFADRLQDPLGVIALLVVVALLALGVVRTVRAADSASRLIAVASWTLPVVVLIGAIALGTHAARYLQPLAFAPVLALVAHPQTLRIPARLRRQAAAVAAAAVLVAGGLSVPRLAGAVERPDADLACVTDWVDASPRIGAGQFWTVRLPKLHLKDPAQLVQVDHRLDGYAWLVNRTDFDAREVTFLLQDSQTVQWELPAAAVPDRIVECGRWTILDFASTPLVLGPTHS